LKNLFHHLDVLQGSNINQNCTVTCQEMRASEGAIWFIYLPWEDTCCSAVNYAEKISVLDVQLLSIWYI